MSELRGQMAGQSQLAEAGSGPMAIRVLFRPPGLDEALGGRGTPRVRPWGSKASRSGVEEESPAETGRKPGRTVSCDLREDVVSPARVWLSAPNAADGSHDLTVGVW